MSIEVFSDSSGQGVWLHDTPKSAVYCAGVLLSTRTIRLSTHRRSVAWYWPGTWVPFSVRNADHYNTGRVRFTRFGTFHFGRRP